jgi:hypothetical protein
MAAESDKSSSATVVRVAQDTPARCENDIDCVEYLGGARENGEMDGPRVLKHAGSRRTVRKEHLKIKNVHIPAEALELLKKRLEEQHLNLDVLTQYLKLAKLVMKLIFVHINGKIYEQTEGTAMENALWPFLANLYMANFVIVLKRRNLLSKVWVRYVDDIFW